MPAMIASIRPAVAADLDEVQACVDHSYALYIPRIGKKPAPMTADYAQAIQNGELFVLEADRQLAGFVQIYPADGYLMLEAIGVFPRWQGQGIGRQLLDFVDQQALQLGLTEIQLYTNEKMTENLTLYPHFGYVEMERKYEDGFNRVYFQKKV